VDFAQYFTAIDTPGKNLADFAAFARAFDQITDIEIKAVVEARFFGVVFHRMRG